MIVRIETPYPNAAELVKRALENYATVQATLQASTTTRALHTGEREEDRQRLVDVYRKREAAAWGMSERITTTEE